jgi:hypothetical protein
MLPFAPRVLALDYLSVNPLGTVPTIFDESSEPCCRLASLRATSAYRLYSSELGTDPSLNVTVSSGGTRWIVIRIAEALPPVRRSPRALWTATVLELLQGHLVSHAEASDEVEPVPTRL